MRCQSPSACVVCSARIAKGRGEWLSELFGKADQRGERVSMLTLTIRHNRTQPLAELLTKMEQAYTNIQATQAFKDLRGRYGAKFVRVLEVTWGKNGWHPHFHIAILHKQGVDFELYRSELQDTWIRFVTAQGLKAPLPDVAVNIVQNATSEQRGWYLTKANGLSSLEFTNGAGKKATNGNLGIWQVHSLAVQGDSQSKAVWIEYENAIRRKRLISPSRGLAEEYGVEWKRDEAFADDETMEIADNLQNAPVMFVAGISAEVWRKVRKKKLVSEMRSILHEGYPALQKFLDENGIYGRVITLEKVKAYNAISEELLHTMRYDLDVKNFEEFDQLSHKLDIADLLPVIEKTIFKSYQMK